MDKLQKLQLDNNIITKISNLENLTELRWLDLSFNMIEKIEGLSTLKNLEDLSLFNNKISKLEGLNDLVNLNVLSVGSNELDHLDDQVLYLHKLNNKLEVLKIKGNKFKETGDKEYKYRIIAYIPELKYLDYEFIDKSEREKAEAAYKVEIENNQISENTNEKTGDEENKLRELREAHIECTQDIFLKCCESFEEYAKISAFNNFKEVYNILDPQVEESVSRFQSEAKQHAANYNAIRLFCMELMSNAERKAEEESI